MPFRSLFTGTKQFSGFFGAECECGRISNPASHDCHTACGGQKTEEVWTNDDLGAVSGQPGATKKTKDALQGSSTRGSAPDPQYIANTKKQLEKLQGQLTDTEQQLSDLKDFQAGKPPATTGAYAINKGYNRIPVDQQISNLENKRTQIQQKIDDLLDEARKKGVEPGQLR